MHFGSVEIPEPLLEARRTGTLVLFVGAGASIAEPSCLPSFTALVDQIRSQAQLPEGLFDGVKSDECDRVLGIIHGQEVNVHKRVHQLLSDGNSRPNSLHKALIALAGNGPARIVTTNFDEHLTTVRTESGLGDWQEYQAPALPLGDDFDGIVYLHGRLSQDPRHLVVTDAGFGRAYLRDAWAARFLERMFAHSTVLFVGYSHNDVIMTYLGRALTDAHRRYVLTDTPAAANWSRLGITPVAYPNDDGSHSEMEVAINAWARYLSMGLLEHRQRITDLTSEQSPTRIPAEQSYLKKAMADEHRVEYFIERARGSEWLTWVAECPEFHSLFQPHTPAGTVSGALSRWFVDNYASNPVLSAEAIDVAQQSGPSLSADLLWQLARSLTSDPGSAVLRKWLPAMIESNTCRSSALILDVLLNALISAGQHTAATTLFEHLTEPHIKWTRSVFGGGSYDIRLRGSDTQLPLAWESFTDHLDALHIDLLRIADAHIRRAHRYMSNTDSARNIRWPLGSGRSAIEAHEQDDCNNDSFDLLIDCARDCLEVALDRDRTTAEVFLGPWQSSNISLLERLAVHGWRYRTDVDADAKIRWLLDTGSLYADPLRHEVFALIEECSPSVADDVAVSLANAASSPSSEVEPRRVYELVHWIARHSSSPVAQSAAEAQRDIHPDWLPREHPDFDSMLITGPEDPRLNSSVAELHNRIASERGSALDDLVQQSRIDNSRVDYGLRDEALTLIEHTIRAFPNDGLLAADSAHLPDVHTAIIRGWTNAGCTNDEALQVVRFITEHLSLFEPQDVLRLLRGSHTPQASGGVQLWRNIYGARQLARALQSEWNSEDPSADACAHPGDVAWQLTEFWVQCVIDDRREASDAWSGMPPDTIARFDDLLASDRSRDSAEEVMATQAVVLYSADPGWFRVTVLPKFSWRMPAVAGRSWRGYLRGGSWRDELMEAGLREGLVETIENFDQLDAGLDRGLWSQIAAVSLRSTRSPMDDDWLARCIRAAKPMGRSAIALQLARGLRSVGSAVADQIWDSWLRKYWTNRIRDIPAAIGIEEAGEMMVWPALFQRNAIEAMGLALQCPARLSSNSLVFHHLTTDFVDRNPSVVARFVVHVLMDAERPFTWIAEVESLIAACAAQSVPEETLTRMRESFARLRL